MAHNGFLAPVLPNTAEGLATFYNVMFSVQGFVLPPHLLDPVRAVMDNRIRKLQIWIGPGSGKSLLFSVVVPAFIVGQDPTMTILGISAGEMLMQGFQRTVMEWVEFSPLYKKLFPGIAPDKVAGWSTERGMFVTGHEIGNPDANYFAAGLTSSALTGKHARIVLIDDFHNKETASSADACMKGRDDYYKTIIGRADPRGARFIAAGRRWHTEDIYAHWKEAGDWVTMELQAEQKNDGESNELAWNITIPEGLTCCFNDGSHPLTESDNAGA